MLSLYFLLIAELPAAQWDELWSWRVSTPDLRSQMTANLVDETYNLATRPRKKYQRTGEAQALFTVGLMCFGLALALTINVLATQAKAPAPWDLRSRLVTMFILSSFASALGYGWVRWKQKVAERRVWPLYLAWWLGVLYPGAVLLPPHVLPVGVGAAFAAAIMLALLVCWSTPSTSGSARGAMVVAVALFTLATPFAVLAEADRWRLALAFGSVVLFEVPRFLSASFDQRPAAKRLSDEP